MCDWGRPLAKLRKLEQLILMVMERNFSVLKVERNFYTSNCTPSS